MNKKRKKYLDWDETFIQMAFLIAQRSKDPSTQAGAVIVDKNNIIVGMGYNGFPRGCDDDKFPWDREGEFCQTKYPYVVHAEENALYNTNKSPQNCTLYCTLFPCNECVKTIIQSGIKKIIYASDKYHDQPAWQAARRMLDASKIKYQKYSPKYKIKLSKK